MADEKGWLIERAPDGIAEWLQLDWGDTFWTTDSHDALRFAREIDARRYIDRHEIDGFVRVTEHIWLERLADKKAEG